MTTEPPLTNGAEKEQTNVTEGEAKAADGAKDAEERSGTPKSEKAGSVPDPKEDVQDNPTVDMRNMRRIIAEDPDWSLATVPLLWELCIKHIVTNFGNNSKILNDLIPKHKGKVLDKISTDLPIKITALLVEDEDYWKRCCKAKWQICDVKAFRGSWKRMYFERNLQTIIEHFVPETTDPTELNETIPLSANFVEKLDIQQLLPPVKDITKVHDDDMSEADGSDAGDGPEIDHFDFCTIFPKLPRLTEFHVTYGVKDCGMNFEWNLFQFTARDCLLLAKCIANHKTLKVFKLHRSKVDDDKVRVLISHILDHPGLEELDLSHNVISDRGARAIGKFINNHSKIVKLNVCDNDIRAAGAQAIAHALTKNTTVTHVNLRLNRLGDEGGQAICRAMLKNSTVTDLNIGSNDLTEPTAAIFSQVVIQNKTLRRVDISCNRIGPDGGKQVQEGMEENQTILNMDLRLTECGQESEYCINQILARNREKAREASMPPFHFPTLNK